MIAVQFLIPTRADHPALRRDLEDTFGGWSLIGTNYGAWRDPATGVVGFDATLRYEVGLDPDKLVYLDEYLQRLARSIGESAIWRVVIGSATALEAST